MGAFGYGVPSLFFSSSLYALEDHQVVMPYQNKKLERCLIIHICYYRHWHQTM